mmetsp:Transcript_5183/g.12869  ORF Transcript_5183/g.12869 Transcript_5183/m.12869 type:complete len:293 (+) Transcript_5183:80-958(+)
MPIVTDAVDVVTVPGTLTISEYFGNVATQDARLSAAHVRITAATEEEWQTPQFDEYVLIVKGEVHLKHDQGVLVVKGGSGVFLPKGFRVKWVFPGPAEYVPICLPAFSPDNVCREDASGPCPANGHPQRSAGSQCCFAGFRRLLGSGGCATKVFKPLDVVAAKDLTITEYFGNVASKDPSLSACLATVRQACAEAYQAPAFDEYVLVLEGEVHLQTDGWWQNTTVVKAGQAAFLKAGERVKWVWPGACKYVPICLPAFSPANCNREEEEGAAKDEETMERLKALHSKAEGSC